MKNHIPESWRPILSDECEKAYFKKLEAFLETERKAHAVFPPEEDVLLWGGYAQKKAKLVDTKKHVIIQMAHPSPLSARSGFFGSKPFSSINKALRTAGHPEIKWQLPEL